MASRGKADFDSRWGRKKSRKRDAALRGIRSGPETGIESLFFGKTATRFTGYAANRAYQRQSGMNNMAVAATALLVFFASWGLFAEITVMTTLLIFMFLSECNHAYSAIQEGNRGIKNLLRPVMTLVLIAFVLPMMIRALG